MIKKILLVGFGVLLMMPAFADDSGNTDETLQVFSPSKMAREEANPSYVANYLDAEDHQTEHVNDFYMRVSGGLESDVSHYNLNDDLLTGKYNAADIFGVLTLGYGRKVYNNELYLGMAIDGSINAASSSFPDNINYPYNGSVSIPYSFGIYLVPGVYVTKTVLAYAKVGGVGSNYKVSVPNNSTFIDSFDKAIFGYRVGGGLDIFLNKDFSFNIEYMFTDYHSFTHDFTSLGQTYRHKFDPYSNQVSVGFAYHLG